MNKIIFGLFHKKVIFWIKSEISRNYGSIYSTNNLARSGVI